MLHLPLQSVELRCRRSGGTVVAPVAELTRWLAYLRVDYSWWRFGGDDCVVPGSRRELQEDGGWTWGSLVRRYRKNPECVRACIRTDDGHVQGAIIYRLDGDSFYAPDERCVAIERLATSPKNREGYAKSPRYKRVGESLAALAILHSYLVGYAGRVNLYSLSRAIPFYTNIGFADTYQREEREKLPLYELRSGDAMKWLEKKGLI